MSDIVAGREYPRGRETSNALAEVRTVLSRAETALDSLDRSGWYRDDADRGEMADAMREVVRLLDRWRRTGRPLTRKEPRQ